MPLHTSLQPSYKQLIKRSSRLYNNPKNRLSLALRSLLILPVLLATMLAAPPSKASAAQTKLLNETFSNSNTAANAWISGAGLSGSEVTCLTAGNVSTPGSSIPACQATAIDSQGGGALRLTTNQGGQAGFAIYNQTIPSTKGLNIEFDMYQYNCNLTVGYDGTTNPKQCYDGIAFFLIDGSKSPTASGVSGGSLGYAGGVCTEKSTNGIEGGFMGVGFDMYGNYSCEDVSLLEHLNDRTLNSLAIRGSQSSKYSLVTAAKTASGALDNQTATTRSAAKRHVTINMSEQSVMNVWINYGSGDVHEYVDVDLKALNGQQAFPSTFKIGFSAGTGGSNYGGPEIHEITGLSVQTLDPDVTALKESVGQFERGKDAEYKITVSNKPSAGTTTGALTMVDTLPEGVSFISAAGNGWVCSESERIVTCQSSAVLGAGQSAPAISLKVAIDSNFPGSKLVNTATATTPDDSDTSNDSNTNTYTFSVPSPSPVAPSTGTVGGIALIVLALAAVSSLAYNIKKKDIKTKSTHK